MADDVAGLVLSLGSVVVAVVWVSFGCCWFCCC